MFQRLILNLQMLKVYRYLIDRKKELSVFDKDFSWHIEDDLKVEAMRDAAKRLIGRRDFSVFAKEANSYKDCTRKLKTISTPWSRMPGREYWKPLQICLPRRAMPGLTCEKL